MKKMTKITKEEASEKYGINCSYSISEDGELRFRLTKNDGTAYIRTEAPPKGEWQDSHWHNKVRETYIVQNEWIGYAELDGECVRYRIYKEGELFTTAPNIIHTVYMPNDAVIHTVKHGNARGEERLEDKRTDDFNRLVKAVSEKELKSLALCSNKSPETLRTNIHNQDYGEPYRHFDNLIWQVPAWSTAIFALLIVGISRLSSDSALVVALGVGIDAFIGILAFSFGLLHLVLSYALYRFRWHQVGVKNHDPAKPLLSPQVWLQLLVNVQSILLFMVAAKLFGVAIEFLISGVVLLVAVIMYFQESTLISKSRSKGLPRSTMS